MAQGIARRQTQTRRAASKGKHPDFQSGQPLNPKKPQPRSAGSWWTNPQTFYTLANDPDNQARMSAAGFGKLNTDSDL